MESPFVGNEPDVLRNIHQRWPISDFCVTLFKDPRGTESVHTDLCSFVLETPNKVLLDAARLDEFRYFPPCTSPSVCDSKSGSLTTRLLQYINAESCHKNGFALSSDGSRHPDRHYKRFNLICQRHGRLRTYKGKGMMKKIERSTALTTQDQCPFCLPVFLDPEIGSFFVRRNSGRCFVHNGHGSQPVDLREETVAKLPAPVLTEAVTLFESHLPTNIVSIHLWKQRPVASWTM